MTSTIVCYGDSLTWGFDADGEGRHRYEDRWPSVVQETLGRRAHVIAEGLNGRTTAYDDHLAAGDRNGARVLPTILATHAPIDVLVLALGSNDLKRHTGGGRAREAAWGMERLVEIARNFPYGFDYDAPEVVIVSPPALVETTDDNFDAMFGFARAESLQFAELFEALARRLGCVHVAASEICTATPTDGIHLDAENTRKLGAAIASTLGTLT
ncbi:SGNH/GDSL hydrolase family protein [Aureimonas jatrophae]|uniref:Lysophospholipase L1 n=1 Tax=Aureimonas jatrophae TaxID=1166073 RepID=A0A1H0GY40_9HYPH|nr:SGNH/GDSL hydrolase family protein [Aureimonas jatrophae]MBB3949863.1 lysophospholipase L1-like esterase [Aureimonas jatrophae]SDO11793.1 Lysophospholipase L1 [Aureimonas jatrophae]